MPAQEARAAQAAPGDGSVSDPDIVYVGRWDTSAGTAAVPSWTGAYFQTAFTGTTVRIKARGAVNLYVSIDGGPDVFHAGVRGTVNLTPRPLPAGTHTLRVSYRSGDTVFQGLVLDPGARTVNPQTPARLVEFVGDSITAGALTDRLALDSYAWKTGEQLGARHTQIARSGYCLVAQSGCTGLSSQFFKTASTGNQGWDFSRYRADAVVINLGTNDIGHGVTGPAFQSAYTRFLTDLRAAYPDAHLFAVQTLKKRYVAETRAAVDARAVAGDGRVHHVDTTGWLTDGTDYEDGNGHPNEVGHTKFANRLAAVVGARLDTPGATRTVAPGQPGDPSIKFVGRWDTRSSPTAYTPYWAGAYYRVGFTGRTVKLKQRGTIDFWARIDNGPVTFHDDVKGTVNLTPSPLSAGNHTLQVNYQVVAGSYRGDAVFQGLVLDSGATTFAPQAPGRLVEFVGDSITVGTTTSQNARTAYDWLIGERLGAEHTQIAQGGACLVAAADGCVGLERQYGKLNPNAATPDWDFAYRADAVVINLGTNDVGHGVSATQFQAAYTSLLRKVRAAHPQAWIFALRTFRGRYVPQTEAAVRTVVEAGDSRVSFVDTTGWLSAGDLTDSVHPNDRGHRVIADRLAPIVAAGLGA
ncbi:GDSL-type esterase/lipase family protein [Streptomyces griseus]|uniref:GDSL-type esterase/lipase family protein n=1 Tax=Streptomyces griseus TaxID=1911 RepID=UPI001F1CBEA9|nr:GDSL-type esterase/lipase family protein [Streptomyces griseus]